MMSVDNKNIVKHWFEDFWGDTYDAGAAEALSTADIVVHHQMHGPKRGREAVNRFMVDLREAFPDWRLHIIGNLIAEGDYVVGRWEGGGTHTGSAYSGFQMGSIVAGSGFKVQITGTTVFRLASWRIAEELGQEDAVTAMKQIGFLELRSSKPCLEEVGRSLPHGWNRLSSPSGIPLPENAARALSCKVIIGA